MHVFVPVAECWLTSLAEFWRELVSCHEYISQGHIGSCKLSKNSAKERKREFAAIWTCAIPAEKCLSRALAASLHSAAVWKTGLALCRFVSSGTCHTGLRTLGRTCNLWCCSHSPSQLPSVPCWPPASCVRLQLKWRNGMGGSVPAARAPSAAYLSDGHPAVHPGSLTSSGTPVAQRTYSLLEKSVQILMELPCFTSALLKVGFLCRQVGCRFATIVTTFLTRKVCRSSFCFFCPEMLKYLL